MPRTTHDRERAPGVRAHRREDDQGHRTREPWESHGRTPYEGSREGLEHERIARSSWPEEERYAGPGRDHWSPYNQGPDAVRGGLRGKGPVGYERSDARIYEDVCDALTDHDELDASAIEVAVAAGEVTLTGHVPDRRSKRTAEDVSERVSGVKDVSNQLRVRAQSKGEGARPAIRSGEAATTKRDPPQRS